MTMLRSAEWLLIKTACQFALLYYHGSSCKGFCTADFRDYELFSLWTAVLVIVMIAVNQFMLRYLFGRFIKLHAIFDKVAEGDFTVQAAVHSDELGAIALSMNNAIEKSVLLWLSLIRQKYASG